MGTREPELGNLMVKEVKKMFFSGRRIKGTGKKYEERKR
jgi:hypothetical protein